MPALKAPPTLTLQTVTDFAAALRPAMAGGEAVTLDLGDVTECDALGFQLIEAARAAAAASGTPLHVTPPTADTARAALARLGAGAADHPHWFAEPAA